MNNNNEVLIDYGDTFLPIVFVNHGIANRFKNRIEINEGLKKYPKLLKIIIDHELSHTNSNFSFKDLFLDLGIPTTERLSLFKFIFSHPRSLTQIFPFYISKGKFIYDINMIIIYSVLLLIIGGSVYFAFLI